MTDVTTSEVPAAEFIPGETPFKEQLKQVEQRVNNGNRRRRDETDPNEKARQIVIDNYNAFRNESRTAELTLALVTIIWFSGNKSNWKAILESPIIHGLRYEVSYSARRGEAFLDVYKKINSIKISDPDNG